MTDYENEVITIRPQLIAKKLRDDNSNVGKECLGCKNKNISKLYEVGYEINEFEYSCFGYYCRECMNKVFGITWNYVEDLLPYRSDWYLVSYADNAVTDAYWNKKQKKWLTIEPDQELTTVYAWAEKPKAARKP